MTHNYRLVACIAISVLCLSLGCKTKQGITYGALERGYQREQVAEIALDSFLIVWIGKETDERGVTVLEICSDSSYTYFHQRGNGYYKVRNCTLLTLDYKSIDGEQIRGEFYNNVVPLSDKQKVVKRSGGIFLGGFDYDAVLDENAILIKFHYKVLFGFIPIMNKHYSARYEIKSGNLTKL